MVMGIGTGTIRRYSFVNDNMVAVQNGSDKWGVWDLEKEILVTSCKYNNIPNDAARYYSEGYAAVQKDGKWGFVDEAGQCVIPCQYDEVGDLNRISLCQNDSFPLRFLLYICTNRAYGGISFQSSLSTMDKTNQSL